MPNNNNNNNRSNRGRFLLRGPIPSLRKSQNSDNNNKKSEPGNRTSLRKTNRGGAGGGGPQLSIYNDNNNNNNNNTTVNQQQLQKTKKRVSFPNPNRSKSPIVNNENVDSTGFSKAELHDLEESFNLFDVYGEGFVQVGDLRGVLESLGMEQQQEDDDDGEDFVENQQSTPSRYPHLKTLLNRLSELEDDDTLNLEDYIQLMASTTISNSIMIESSGGEHRDTQQEHFARVFRLFDTNDTGYITLKDLQRVAVELGEHDMTKGELQEMIDRAVESSGSADDGDNDSNNDTNNQNGEKKVGIEEFTRMMTMSLFPSN